MQYVTDEKELFTALEQLIHTWDPDILIGYEVQMLSWGYLFQRAKEHDKDLAKELSRVKGRSSHSNMDPAKDQWGARHTSEISIPGRIMLNVWRLMRHEVCRQYFQMMSGEILITYCVWRLMRHEVCRQYFQMMSGEILITYCV